MPIDVRAHTPKKWVKLGSVLLIKVPEILKDYEVELGEAFSTLEGVKTVAVSPEIKGELREPFNKNKYYRK